MTAAQLVTACQDALRGHWGNDRASVEETADKIAAAAREYLAEQADTMVRECAREPQGARLYYSGPGWRCWI